jgi:hypothetical protein
VHTDKTNSKPPSKNASQIMITDTRTVYATGKVNIE